MHDCRAAIAFSYTEKIGHCIPNAAYLHFSILNLYKDQEKKYFSNAGQAMIYDWK